MKACSHPYVLVAERSVLGSIDSVVASLEKHGGAEAITIVVPASQVTEFRSTRCGSHEVLSEDDILPGWPLGRVRSQLGRRADRAGWYLQQFLKLAFGVARGVEWYVIWDADTVMLRRPAFESADGRVLMNAAREHHRPYFDTFRRLFGEDPVLHASVVSQYMLIDTSVVRQMFAEIEARHRCGWVEAILGNLPGRSPSEFSEYETYANYLERRRPGAVTLTRERWFRYGSEIVPADRRNELASIERTFARYAYVSFERHGSNTVRRALAHLLLRAPGLDWAV